MILCIGRRVIGHGRFPGFLQVGDIICTGFSPALTNLHTKFRLLGRKAWLTIHCGQQVCELRSRLTLRHPFRTTNAGGFSRLDLMRRCGYILTRSIISLRASSEERPTVCSASAALSRNEHPAPHRTRASGDHHAGKRCT